MNNTDEQKRLWIEAVTSSWRPSVIEQLPVLPAWHDLDEESRRKSFEETALQRWVESSVDPEGLNSTSRRVLAKILSGNSTKTLG